MIYCVEWDTLSAEMKQRIVTDLHKVNGVRTLPEKTFEPKMLTSTVTHHHAYAKPTLDKDACTPAIRKVENQLVQPTDFETHFFQSELARVASSHTTTSELCIQSAAPWCEDNSSAASDNLLKKSYTSDTTNKERDTTC